MSLSSDLNDSVPLKTVLLKPKLHTPLPRPEFLSRPRLLELLKAGSDRKITLIDAPAGYGKTTLLTQWRQSQEGDLPFAWVSLDEKDNDPARLWMHIIEALHQVAPEEVFGADGFVGLGVNGRSLIKVVLPTLINELTEFPRRAVLVLDDYHCVKARESHELLAFFIEHLPETVHLVLSTRYDLPLPLGWLRARGELNEIRAEQLAFSEEEAASLLKDRLHLEVDPDDLRTLLDRTEGWPAGIYLAALSLGGGTKDTKAFIQSFQGSNRFIVEILAEEVLGNLSGEQREFMLRTSILRRMSPSLCEVVTGMKSCGRLLCDLERSNLFVVPLDEQGEWYRYHNLFAGFLRYELRSTQPELLPVLHERASKWFEQAGLIEAAIHHALEAKEYGRVGLLVARHWFGYAASGQMVTVERWLDALPEGFIDCDAALSLVRAWLCGLQGRPKECERFLALAEGCSYEGELPDGSASVEAGVALVRGIFGYGGVQTMLEAARRAQELESEQTSPRAALARLAAGMSLYYAGEFSGARKPLEEALRLIPVDQPILRNGALCFLSLVCSEEGRLGEAESLACEAQAIVKRFRLERIPQSSQVPIALGRALAARGKMAEAQIELERCFTLRRRFPSLSPWPTLVGLLALAPVLLGQGDRAEARILLAEARSIVEKYPDAGMFPALLERWERVLRRGKLHRGKRPQGTLTPELSERELAVLRLLDGERTNREIGHLLYVSPNTVKAHVKSIYRKLGVSSRKEAVEQARAMQLPSAFANSA